MWLALCAVILGTFVTVLNNSLINVAIPQMTNVFGSTTDTMQWVLKGYPLAAAIVIPLSGFLGDRFGTKKLFILALSGFTISSVFCGLAWSDVSLIAFRVLQGISGGVLAPLSMTIIYGIVPKEKVGTALGIWALYDAHYHRRNEFRSQRTYRTGLLPIQCLASGCRDYVHRHIYHHHDQPPDFSCQEHAYDSVQIL